MEHKETPELDAQEIPLEELPVLPESESESASAQEGGFVDYFADILPEQPVEEESSLPAQEETTPIVTADTAVLSDIQSAVASILSEEAAWEEAQPERMEEPTAKLDMVSAISSAVEEQIQHSDAAVPAPEAEPQPESTEDLLPEEAQENSLREVQADDGFEEMSNAKAPELPLPNFDRPVRKGRPRRRKGEFLFGIPQIAVTCVWLAIILVTGLTLGRMLWVCAADVLAFGREDKMVTVTVYESDTMEDIIEKLHKADLIRYPGLFKLYADLAVDEGEIKPGIWDLNTMYDYHALVNMMSPSSSRTVVENVLIPEGFTCRQIFALLEENRVCTAKDLAEYAANGELKDYWFLENVERGFEYCLEGFLFPDTYDFYKNSNPRDVLEKLLDNFEFRFNEEMRAQIDTLNANVTGGTFDIHKVVIVASMIEKETANNEESPRIASVIYNRLFKWGNTPPYLNIDASIVYALDGKTDLTAEDLQIESPYNTYTNTGLTPGAISNPGLASLKAALNPETTNYYYYVLNPAEGVHKFSTTLDEHNAFIATLE